MNGGGAPCGACKFLRRKCVKGCVFAPYFGSDQGAAHFAAVHKIFGASNVSKLLLHIPTPERCEAVVTISYEAQARLRDPVYGCVAHIFALQQQVANLQAELALVQAQLASRTAGTSMQYPQNGNHENISAMSSSSAAAATDFNQRPHHQFDTNGTPVSMSIPSPILYPRIKEENGGVFSNCSMDYEFSISPTYADDSLLSAQQMEALQRTEAESVVDGREEDLQAYLQTEALRAFLRRN